MFTYFQCCHFVLPEVPVPEIYFDFQKFQFFSKAPGKNSKMRPDLVPKIVKFDRVINEIDKNPQNPKNSWKFQEFLRFRVKSKELPNFQNSKLIPGNGSTAAVPPWRIVDEYGNITLNVLLLFYLLEERITRHYIDSLKGNVNQRSNENRSKLFARNIITRLLKN